MSREMKVFESIVFISRRSTDFDSGFDRLFGFMAENPESRTTKGFVSYHIDEMNDPRTPIGDVDFNYLIGKEFVAEHWVSGDDLDKFQKYCEACEEQE